MNNAFEVYFSPWYGGGPVRLSYALRTQFGSVGFSDRGPLTIEFPNIESMKDALHKVDLPASIASGGFASKPITVTVEQMRGLGFDFPRQE